MSDKVEKHTHHASGPLDDHMRPASTPWGDDASLHPAALCAALHDINNAHAVIVKYCALLGPAGSDPQATADLHQLHTACTNAIDATRRFISAAPDPGDTSSSRPTTEGT